jgi:hypothetical protein
MLGWFAEKFENFLNRSQEVQETPLCDFSRLRFEIRPCDVVLVEGRTRVSAIIRTITLSRWTHAALFIGRLSDIEDEETRNLVKSFYPGDPNEQLIIESLLGSGAIVSPLTKYQYDNLRICRPKEISPQDVLAVIKTAAGYLGSKYDMRHILDFARFLVPYWFIPGKWRSSLFEYSADDMVRTICSTVIVEAFASNQYPVLPVIQRTEEGKYIWSRRNPKLFTPDDFDYSPYFDIIKYPFLGDEKSIYKRLPWDKTGVICNDETECFLQEESGGTKNKSTGNNKQE